MGCPLLNPDPNFLKESHLNQAECGEAPQMGHHGLPGRAERGIPLMVAKRDYPLYRGWVVIKHQTTE